MEFTATVIGRKVRIMIAKEIHLCKQLFDKRRIALAISLHSNNLQCGAGLGGGLSRWHFAPINTTDTFLRIAVWDRALTRDRCMTSRPTHTSATPDTPLRLR